MFQRNVRDLFKRIAHDAPITGGIAIFHGPGFPYGSRCAYERVDGRNAQWRYETPSRIGRQRFDIWDTSYGRRSTVIIPRLGCARAAALHANKRHACLPDVNWIIVPREIKRRNETSRGICGVRAQFHAPRDRWVISATIILAPSFSLASFLSSSFYFSRTSRLAINGSTVNSCDPAVDTRSMISLVLS